jgi:hypothetical protein
MSRFQSLKAALLAVLIVAGLTLQSTPAQAT